MASTLVLVAGDAWRPVWWGFAAIGLVGAAVNLRVLTDDTPGAGIAPPWPGFRWFLGARSVPLFVVTLGAAITSGAYFAYAPDTAQAAGLAPWSGPGMFATLGVAGAGVGVFGGGIADRFGLRRPLVASLVLIAGSTLLMLAMASLGVHGHDRVHGRRVQRRPGGVRRPGRQPLAPRRHHRARGPVAARRGPATVSACDRRGARLTRRANVEGHTRGH